LHYYTLSFAFASASLSASSAQDGFGAASHTRVDRTAVGRTAALHVGASRAASAAVRDHLSSASVTAARLAPLSSSYVGSVHALCVDLAGSLGANREALFGT